MWRILLLVGMQTGTVTAKNSMEVSQKKKKKLKELPYNPAILLPSIQSKHGNGIQKSTHTHMFTAVLFTTAKRWK